MFAAFLLLVFLIVGALVWLQGFWGGVLAFVQVLFCALLATAYYEPLAAAVAREMREYSYVIDILAAWGIFALAYALSRGITALLARQQIQFHPWMELGGRSVAAIVVAYVFVMFTAFTVHLAPVEAEPFGGWQADPGGGFRPDIQWISFVRGQSMMGLRGSSTFDPKGQLIRDYKSRRKALESESGFLSQ